MATCHPVDNSVRLLENFCVGRAEQIIHRETFVVQFVIPNMRPNWLQRGVIDCFSHTDHHAWLADKRPERDK